LPPDGARRAASTIISIGSSLSSGGSCGRWREEVGFGFEIDLNRSETLENLFDVEAHPSRRQLTAEADSPHRRRDRRRTERNFAPELGPAVMVWPTSKSEAAPRETPRELQSIESRTTLLRRRQIGQL